MPLAGSFILNVILTQRLSRKILRDGPRHGSGNFRQMFWDASLENDGYLNPLRLQGLGPSGRDPGRVRFFKDGWGRAGYLRRR